MVQPEWNEAGVEIKMLAEEVPETFVAFRFQKSAWVEVKVLFDWESETADATDAKNPDSTSSWKLNLQYMIVYSREQPLTRKLI